MDLELKRKSAPVTGANQGIGPAKAKGLAGSAEEFRLRQSAEEMPVSGYGGPEALACFAVVLASR